MMTKYKVSESIFNGESAIIPMAEVHHIQKNSAGGILVILNNTKWNYEQDFWENPVYLTDGENKDTGWKSTEATDFMKAWCKYRHELEGGEDAFYQPEDID